MDAAISIGIDHLPGEAVRAALSGRLDITGVAEIERALDAALGGSQAVILDLTGVTLITSTGVRLLFHSAAALADRGGKLVLLGPEPRVERVLRVSGVDGLIPMFHDLDAAVAALSDPAP